MRSNRREKVNKSTISDAIKFLHFNNPAFFWRVKGQGPLTALHAFWDPRWCKYPNHCTTIDRWWRANPSHQQTNRFSPAPSQTFPRIFDKKC
ncbi:hypothetical protein TNIN_88731 [Trichonephila inaurata madagascariensis]|uniref:Uncharacterized protein n=1 Tax=Trichonephila inaurata madagascariensis TaxID=2747483 RepID=A0A8X6Y025_9ARAC|nr:hypothetical protein TNIN_88731 [Trichonephila inaurata madagascariensis]